MLYKFNFFPLFPCSYRRSLPSQKTNSGTTLTSNVWQWMLLTDIESQQDLFVMSTEIARLQSVQPTSQNPWWESLGSIPPGKTVWSSSAGIPAKIFGNIIGQLAQEWKQDTHWNICHTDCQLLELYWAIVVIFEYLYIQKIKFEVFFSLVVLKCYSHSHCFSGLVSNLWCECWCCSHQHYAQGSSH